MLPQISKVYIGYDIFSVNKFTLLLQSNRLTPDKTFTMKIDKYTGGKFSTERVLARRNVDDGNERSSS